MKIAIDLDSTITASKESIEFFEILTHLLHPDPEYRIVILTNREPGAEQEIADELDYLGIEYSEIVITDRKAEYIRDNKISIYFENEDFSFSAEKWIGNKKTVKMID
jgi:hypothetical protein